MLEAAGQAVPDSTPSLEINLGHTLVRRLAETSEQSRFDDLAWVLLGQAQIAEGDLPGDPGAYHQAGLTHVGNSALDGGMAGDTSDGSSTHKYSVQTGAPSETFPPKRSPW